MDCEYQLYNGTSMQLAHFPGRKKPVLAIFDKRGECKGYAIFKDDRSQDEFVKFFDELLKVEVEDGRD